LEQFILFISLLSIELNVSILSRLITIYTVLAPVIHLSNNQGLIYLLSFCAYRKYG